MKVVIEDISSIKKRLNFEVPKEVVAGEFASVYRSIRKKAKIKGFRPGKVPREIIERNYKQQIEDEVTTKLINDTFLKAVEEHKISAVSQPAIDAEKFEKEADFKFSAEVEVKPEISIEGYLGLEGEREVINITDQDVLDSLRRIQNTHAELKEVDGDHPIEKGDFVFFDFMAAMDGKPYNMGENENISLEIGSNSFVPGFDDELLGLTKNSEKTVEINFPKDFKEKSLGGKKIVFQVRLKQIKEKILPKLDDEFAKDVTNNPSLAELKNKVREDLERQAKARIRHNLKEQIIDKILDKNQFDVPRVMIETRANSLMESTQARMKDQGINFENLGISLDNMRKNYINSVEREIKTNFILESIAGKESFKVNDDEVEARLQEVADSSEQSLDRIKELYRQGSAIEELKVRLLEEKTIDFLVEKAKIKDIGTNKENLKEKE